MTQPVPYDEIEMWHGHPDLYINKLKSLVNTPDDNDIGYLTEVDLGYPDDSKKTKNFTFAPENKVFPEDKFEYMKTIEPKNIQNQKKYYVIGLTKRII